MGVPGTSLEISPPFIIYSLNASNPVTNFTTSIAFTPQAYTFIREFLKTVESFAEMFSSPFSL